MDGLPEECVQMVMSYAGPRQTCKLAVLSKSLWSASLCQLLWQNFLPAGYESAISRSTSLNLLSSSDTRWLVGRLCQRPLLIDQGKKSWMMEKQTGKVTIMVGCDDLRMSGNCPWNSKRDDDCWFGRQVKTLKLGSSFAIRAKIHTGMLSPSTLYAAYLVFKLEERKPCSNPRSIKLEALIMNRGQGGRLKLKLKLKPKRDNRVRWDHSGVGLALYLGMYRKPTRKLEMEWKEKRGKGWREAKLGQFWSHAREDEDDDRKANELIDIFVRSTESTRDVTDFSKGKCMDVTVYGIELRPNY
ncbi:Putative F-box protein PP2-B8 [Linum grandiflorum]